MLTLKKLLALAALLLSMQPAIAAEIPPSEASVKQLLVLTDSKKVLDMTAEQVNSALEAALLQANSGKAFSKKEQKILSKMKASIVRVFNEEMSWKTMEPMFVSIYQRSLSQEEVDGMIAFYSSDAGRAVVKKMPLLVQNSMQAVQGQMIQIAPKIDAIQQDAIHALEQLEKARK